MTPDLVIYSVGDLVKFTAPPIFESAKADYANPGIIIGMSNFEMPWEASKRTSYRIRWNDGRVTKEFGGYLERLNK